MYIIIMLLSIWQSILFFGKKPGISAILFVLPFIIFLIKYLEKQEKIKNSKAKLIAIPIIMLSSTYFIFNNDFLNDLNTIVIPGLIILMVMELIIEKFTLEKIINNMLNFIMKPMGYFGIVGKNMAKKISKKEKTEIKGTRNYARIFKSILISIPILMVVLILLATADSDFLKLFSNIFSDIINLINKIQLSSMGSRILIIIFAFFYMAGFVENIVNTKDIVRNNKELKQKDTLTIKMIITLLNVIYLAFCIIQIKFLFTLYTMNKNNINYSYYARQGFFQLMLVSAINLITILISKSKCYKKEKYIKIMDLTMIVLTAVILLSSFIRMYLYQHNFGFTLKRVLVFWAEITEGILLIPTVMYVLDKKLNLARTYFTIIVTMYVILNFANINRIIAKVNVDMYLKRSRISGSDVYYLTNLGTDAIPEVLRLSDLIDRKERQEIESRTKYVGIEQILDEYENKYKKDWDLSYLIRTLKTTYNEINNKTSSWQEFNISKIKAKRILEEKLTVR